MNNNASAANRVFKQQLESFFKTNADLLALTEGGPNAVLSQMKADLRLERSFQEDLEAIGKPADEEGISLNDQGPTRVMFQHEVYRHLCLSFLRLQVNCVVKLTPEAEEQLGYLRRMANMSCIDSVMTRQTQQAQQEVGIETESLDQEIIGDWKGQLTTAQIRNKKKSNPQYGARLDAMLEDGTLK